MVKMYDKSNIFGIVGSDNNPKLKNDEVIIWDDLKNKIIYKFLLKKKVLNLLLTLDKIVIVCRRNIYVYNLQKDLIDFQLIDIIKSGGNDLGLVAINYNPKNFIIVYPSTGESKGKLTIKSYKSKNYLYLNPHNSNITCITLNKNGNLLATASENGEEIRIFDTKNGELLDELYRKRENNNNIKFIFIDSDNKYVGTSCQNGVISVWSLKKSMNNIDESEKKPFEEENIDISNIHGNFINKETNIKEIILKDKTYENIQFGINNILIIITADGQYFKVKFKVNKEKDDYQVIKQDQLF